MNFRMIKQTLGYLLMFEAAFLLVPLITAIVFEEKKALFAFGVTILLCLVCGILLVSVGLDSYRTVIQNSRKSHVIRSAAKEESAA